MDAQFPRVYESPTELVGRTPLLRLGKLFPDATVLGKLESFNPAGSVKDRTALSIVRAAEADGRLQPGGTILEATSGNTGIALAWIGAALGYKVVICMPDDVSTERRALLRALGAELVLTPGADAMAGANQEAGRILERTPGAFLSGQGGNAANPSVHRETTGPEIWEDTGGKVDVLVSTVGTGGTITGAGSYLRSKNPDLTIYAVEPAEAPVLSGGQFRPHKIQGIIGGNGFPPVLDTALYDEVISIPSDEAIATSRELIRVEGLLAGVSAGANLAAARIVAARPEHAGQTIVTFLCDTAERYVSSELFDHVRETT
ncbi:MAG: cysteine synthase A [Actinobacteria bacterium]|nr:cysteine synthase A [Actinomycetota bacterium]